tara:strand:- start:45 stop:782 length:738 start_codon:yes stop_codon:yes gene_type:complete
MPRTRTQIRQPPTTSMYREPHEIIGSTAWVRVKNKTCRINNYNASSAQKHFFEGMSHENKMNYINNIPHKFGNIKFATNIQELDNINFWTDENGWQYIEGGEFSDKWVNPNYPNMMFNGAKITLSISPTISETTTFPVSSLEDDPKGIALRFARHDNKSIMVIPNKWTHHDDTRRGRKQRRYGKMCARRYSRWEQFDNANKIKNPMERHDVLAGLKMKFYSEDVENEQQKMGYTNEEIALANNAD